MKALSAFFFVCVAGVAVSFVGSIYTAVQVHQEKCRPQPTVFPTPASDAAAGAGSVPAPANNGGLPTPAGG